jgi:hypothetical protein
MPELITVCWNNGVPYSPIYGVQGPMEVFNPSEPRVYETMQRLLAEIQRRFPSNHIHLGKWMHRSMDRLYKLDLGMDEVYEKCW